MHKSVSIHIHIAMCYYLCMSESQETLVLTKERAETQIRELLQEVALMGANDSEFGDFDKILQDLDSGKLSPVEALERAKTIQLSKMDYH